MRTIRLHIDLTPVQAKVDASPARFKMLKWGRRTGKTKYEAYFLAKNALKRKDKHWYVTKTLALGREEFWPALLDLLPRDLVAKTDERLLNVRLTNGSVIQLKSGEKEDNLRGRGLGSVVLDEAAFLKEAIWDRILRPQLAGSRGPAIIGSSPKKGWFTRLYDQAAKGGDENWLASKATIYDNPYIERDEIEVIKAKTPISTWLREYMAEEQADEGQVYDEFSGKNVFDPSKSFLDVRTYPTILGIDWGLADPTGVSWVSFSPEGYLIISEEHEQKGWDVNRHSGVVHAKSTGFNITDRVLDGTAFRKEGTSLVSIWDQFRDAGIYCQRSEKDVTASVDILKRFIHGDGEKPWFYISSKCERTIDAFQNWEHGNHEPDIAAAARYASVWGVRRKLSRLADLIPAFKIPNNPVSRASADLIFAAQARIVPTNRRKSWGWNHQSGAPY